MTELNTVVGTSLAAILAINEEIAALAEQAKAKRQAALEPFLEALAESGQVSLIIVRGYTPGFNDGEPCEHSADFWVNLKEAHGEDLLEYGDYGLDLDDDLIEALGYNAADEANTAVAAEHGHIWAPPSQEIRSAISQIIFDAVEDEESTNYYRTYVLEDGKFVMKAGEYDCGY